MGKFNYTESIKAIKQSMGDSLVILTHHYQRAEIVELGDFKGDSLKLSKIAAQQKHAKQIVFCGVHFMAEAARILAEPEQRVFLPDQNAGCPMADMAQLNEVEDAWKQLAKILPNKKIIPITYVNSLASIKAFCGKHDGGVCTSSNAKQAFKWAFKRGDVLFFFPDKYLGSNTANGFGISPEQKIIWSRNALLGGNSEQNIKNAKVVLWNGYCHVHQWFMPEHVEKVRTIYPGCSVIVHPESAESVVNISDYAGSTGFIVDYVKQSKPGSTIVIGTEINLVSRLAKEFPDRKIVPLAPSLCPNMYKVNLEKLYNTLKSFDSDKYEVFVEPEIAKYAKIALNRMLEM